MGEIDWSRKDVSNPDSVYVFAIDGQMFAFDDLQAALSTQSYRLDHIGGTSSVVGEFVSPFRCRELQKTAADAATKAERERGDALRAAIGALADVLFAPKNSSVALNKAMEMIAQALAQDDGALRKMKGIDQ